MKNGLLKSVVLGVLVAGVMSAGFAGAAVNVTVNNADPYVGYMNVFNLPSDGGAFQFGSGWGTADLCAVWQGGDLKLSPNTIGDPNPYWYLPSGGPGSTGNKIMEANMYVEPAGSLPGQTITFSGVVVSNTLTTAHVAKAFIRDFAPDFSSSVDQFVELPASGAFSVTLSTINDPARHVQYGFQMKGVNVWVTDVAPYGSVVVGPSLPTPTQSTSWGRVKSLYR
jgi:hypothetical protein